MTDIILHHYAASPFAEKVRVALGLKPDLQPNVQASRFDNCLGTP